jgi:hypothetical protein
VVPTLSNSTLEIIKPTQVDTKTSIKPELQKEPKLQ